MVIRAPGVGRALAASGPNAAPACSCGWSTYVAELAAGEALLQADPDLLRPQSAMPRLHWLGQQRFDQGISGGP